MLLLPAVLSFLSRSVLSISTLSPVCPASCQTLSHLFFHPGLPHLALTLSSVLFLGPDSIPLSPSIPTSGPLEPQLVLIRRGRGKTVHWGLKRDVNSPLANTAPLLSPACVSTRSGSNQKHGRGKKGGLWGGSEGPRGKEESLQEEV